MINGLKQLKNLSIPQKLIRAMIVKLFKVKIKLGQSLSRAAKTQAIENIFKEPKKVSGKNTKQLADELHKQYKKPKQLRKIHFRSKDNIWNADLVIMPPENNYKYILTVLDGYTRYAWCVPLKDKKGETVANAFKEIMKKSNRKPNKLWVDQGKEFYNEDMYKLFKFKKEEILKKDKNGEKKSNLFCF